MRIKIQVTLDFNHIGGPERNVNEAIQEYLTGDNSVVVLSDQSEPTVYQVTPVPTSDFPDGWGLVDGGVGDW